MASPSMASLSTVFSEKTTKKEVIAEDLKAAGYIQNSKEVTRNFVQDLLNPKHADKLAEGELLYFHMNYNWDTERLKTHKRDYQTIEKELQETFHLYKLKGTKHKIFSKETEDEPAHIQSNVSQGEYVAYIPGLHAGNRTAIVKQMMKDIAEHLTATCKPMLNKLMPTKVFFLVSVAIYYGEEKEEEADELIGQY